MLLTPVFALLLAQLAFAQNKDDFNIYQGAMTQVQHDYDPAHELTFTLTGGQPYV